MRFDDKKITAVKFALAKSAVFWIMIILGMVYISLTEPNNSGYSDLIDLLVVGGITFVLCAFIFVVHLRAELKKQGD